MVALTRIRLGEDFFRTPIVVPCSSLDHLRKCSSFAPRISVHQQEGNTAYPLWRCTRDSWKAFTDHHTSIPSLLRTCHQKGKRVLYPSGPRRRAESPSTRPRSEGQKLKRSDTWNSASGRKLCTASSCTEASDAWSNSKREVVEVQRLQSQNEQINVSGMFRIPEKVFKTL